MYILFGGSSSLTKRLKKIIKKILIAIYLKLNHSEVIQKIFIVQRVQESCVEVNHNKRYMCVRSFGLYSL